MALDIQAEMARRLQERVGALSSQNDILTIILNEVSVRALAVGVSLDDLDTQLGDGVLDQWKAVAEQRKVESNESD